MRACRSITSASTPICPRQAAMPSPACAPPTTSTVGSRSAKACAARRWSAQFAVPNSRE
jgi:hypothetical protein